MRLSELEAASAATLVAIREGRASESDPIGFPFYGYYEADIFECPPFLMFTNNDCPRALNILYAKRFEPGSMKIWCRLARKATGILDIGANVGVYSLAAASLRKDIPIHAFEPNPHAYTRLRMHRLLNNFKNIVEHVFAVGDRNEYVEFNWKRKNFEQISSGGGTSKREGEGFERLAVPMQALDGTGLAATLGKRPLIKIDVEGGEVNTMNGMKEILALKPDIILETFDERSCNVINELLMPLGYNAYQVFELEGKLERRDKLKPCDPFGYDYNQFLTVRTSQELGKVLS